MLVHRSWDAVTVACLQRAHVAAVVVPVRDVAVEELLVRHIRVRVRRHDLLRAHFQIAASGIADRITLEFVESSSDALLLYGQLNASICGSLVDTPKWQLSRFEFNVPLGGRRVRLSVCSQGVFVATSFLGDHAGGVLIHVLAVVLDRAEVGAHLGATQVLGLVFDDDLLEEVVLLPDVLLAD